MPEPSELQEKPAGSGQVEKSGYAVKYKLRLTITIPKSSKKVQYLYRTFTWEDKDNALECMNLLRKAEKSPFLHIEFVEFTEERPLVA